MKNFFKRIWNYLFKKKQRTITFDGKTVPVYDLPKRKEPINFQDLPEIRSGKIFQKGIALPKYSHKLSFRKQQLIGKVLIFGKDRFRIHQRIQAANKFKYYVDKLI